MESTKRVHIEKAQNFMRQYRDPESRELRKLSANQFMEVWSHYDKDGNGYIEGTELDGFLREFVSSANATNVGPEVNNFPNYPHMASMMRRICSIVIRFVSSFQTLTDAVLDELKA